MHRLVAADAEPLPPLITPRVLGVDDFALYRNTYATLLVDATTRLPLTLWEGRDAEQLSRWLREHPGVEIVCRDGALTYRQGIAAGAPDAVQVSDRFHLWQGLSRRVQDIAAAHRGCLPAALPPAEEAAPAPAEATTEDAAADTRAGQHARRLFQAVHALTGSGQSYSAVARQLALDRRTVRKYARARTWQEVVRRPPRKPCTLDPYRDYLQQRWDEGEHNAMVPHQELRTKGYLGHYQRVKMAIAPLRRGLPLDQPRERPPSPRETARWIATHPDRRGLDVTHRLHRLLEHCPELKHAHDLVRRFAAMLDNRDAAPLPSWLDELSRSGLAPFAGIAGALREDQHAVAQGISTTYSSGVNEGRITDVKLQKRLMARTCWRSAPAPPHRPVCSPPPPLRGPADHGTQMISAYENLARATSTRTPTIPIEPSSFPVSEAPWKTSATHSGARRACRSICAIQFCPLPGSCRGVIVLLGGAAQGSR
ncbi:transposase [Streptomyces capitiformicae]|uniref:HTH IS21-type domain-containing protein n=1 Tax=Streptomyces capitiformicae TaxID=2014920 RepID=A0A918ZQW2_9ACTN|nr:transposase [Streptomyces capitiformicae]GHE66185.1 hypothetical protein GCM10017771_89770 [Streptomyces capitiformicae]